MSLTQGLCLSPTMGFLVRPGLLHFHTGTPCIMINIFQLTVAHRRRKTTAEIMEIIGRHFVTQRILIFYGENVHYEYAMVRITSSYLHVIREQKRCAYKFGTSYINCCLGCLSRNKTKVEGNTKQKLTLYNMLSLGKAMSKKWRNQKEIPTPQTEVVKTKLTIRYFY